MAEPLPDASNPLARRRPERWTLFFCVGSRKAATSWLGRTLARHLSAGRALHRWTLGKGPISEQDGAGRRRRPRWAQGPVALSLLRPGPWRVRRARRDLDTPRDPSVDRHLDRPMRGHRGRPVAGEALAEHAPLGAETSRHMAALHPDARFVHDPVDRLRSSVRHRFRTDIRATAALARRADEAFAAPLDRRRWTFRMSDHAAAIGAPEAAVGPERVHRLFLETVRSREEMDRLGGLLGIGSIPFEAERRVEDGTRGGLAPDAAAAARAREALDRVRRWVEARFAAAVHATWRLSAPG